MSISFDTSCCIMGNSALIYHTYKLQSVTYHYIVVTYNKELIFLEQSSNKPLKLPKAITEQKNPPHVLVGNPCE